MNHITSQLYSDGFYMGDVSEFLDELTEFNTNCDLLRSMVNDLDKYFMCQYIVGSNDIISEPELAPHIIPINEVIKRDELVSKYDLTVLAKNYMLKSLPETNELYQYFTDISTNFLQKLFLSDIQINYRGLQLYLRGGSQNPHTDQHNNCDVAFLMYLSNDEYNNSGGALKITDLGIECPPTRGKFAILEIRENNPKHEVTLLVDDFKRLSFLTFAAKK